MIVARLKGGLGNQLFQYAAGRALAHRLDAPLKLGLGVYKRAAFRSYWLDRFEIQATSTSPLYDRLFPFLPRRFRSERNLARFGRLFGEISLPEPKSPADEGVGLPAGMTPLYDRQDGFDERFLSISGDVYLHGYWQSERYFAPIAEPLRRELKFRFPPDAENRALLEKIRSTEAVALHVRRGDYLVLAHNYGCSPDYYRRAVERLQPHVRDPHYFIFSDDPEWTRAEIKPGPNCTYVTHNTGRQDYEDLRLMSHCRHFIMANSTFSWWGAWLGEFPDKRIICPTPWYADPSRSVRDLIPDAWIQL
jgi:hypothetical protein